MRITRRRPPAGSLYSWVDALAQAPATSWVMCPAAAPRVAKEEFGPRLELGWYESGGAGGRQGKKMKEGWMGLEGNKSMDRGQKG